jgi:hypothetical protein
MPRKRPVKMPVPPPLKCSITDGTGKGCENTSDYKVTRLDKSTYDVCAHHARVLRDQIVRYPQHFDRVRFTQLKPKEQLTKY